MFPLSQRYFLLFILILFVFVISLFYFYIFAKNRERYINFWAMSWIMYAFSLGFNAFLISQPASWLLVGGKQICDLISSLFLLAGAYSLLGRKFPVFWIQFSIVNILWIGMAVYYELSYLIITLLSSVFFSFIAIVTGVMLQQYWAKNIGAKLIVMTVFAVWGVYKAYYPYLYPALSNSSIGYAAEIILANMLNFCIMLIYLQKIRDELTKSEKLFRILAENAQDMIYVYQLSPNLRYEYVSPSCKNITGYLQEDFLHNPNMFTGIVHPEDLVFLEALFDPASSLSEPVTLRLKHRSGHYVWTEQKTTFIKDSENRMSRVEGILRDITDRKCIEESLINTEKSKQTLLTNISHELRTPITSIVGYIATLRENPAMAHNRERYMELIYKKALHLQRLIQDLFQLTQLESGQISFNFSQITVREFIEEILKKYQIDVVQKNRKLEIVSDETDSFLDSYLIMDMERIDQVCSNIIFNALKYTAELGRIVIGAHLVQEAQAYLEVSISDTGPGISEADIHKVFDRFYRSATNDVKLEGSGLGLAISKEIIEFHGGKVAARSTLGEGSTFIFTVPIYDPNKR